MSTAQRRGFHPLACPHLRLSARGSRAVCSLGEDRQGRVALQTWPGAELLVADGTLGTDVNVALGVPVRADAVFTESMTTGDGYRVVETIQAYDAR